MKRYRISEKINGVNLSLKAYLMIIIGITVLLSISGTLLLEAVFDRLLPLDIELPHIVQLIILSLIIIVVLARFISNLFYKPIKDICSGMQKVAHGDFSVQLESGSISGEIQEMISGFNMMAKELSSIETLQSDFISNVSHEFKTPINAVEGYTTLLQGTDNIDETENYYIEKILLNTRKLSSLVSSVLLLSKVENQSIQTNMTQYDLSEQVREAIVMLEHMWEPKEIDFDIELEDIQYYGNENLIFHVWSNLISNAVKFSPRQGSVKMRLNKKGNSIIFCIENNGPHLSDTALKHIFDKFYQEDTSHKAEGNGLGLALVKRILTIAGGSITAENIADSGCRFTVLLADNTKMQ